MAFNTSNKTTACKAAVGACSRPSEGKHKAAPLIQALGGSDKAPERATGHLLADRILLGADVHRRQYVVSRQIDGSTPQPAQRFTPEAFIPWVAKQQLLAKRVICCYEAGPFGYGLYRQLRSMGVECYVVRPKDWDTYGQRVKTDERDARAMAEALEKYVCGNARSFSVVKVPEPEQEQQRAISRQRDTFVREVRRLGSWGRGMALTQGHHMSGRWWRAKAWPSWQKKLPQWLVGVLEPMRQLLEQLEVFVAQSTQKIEDMAQPAWQRPKALGALTEQIISHEVIDWSRFKNRRQVASYTGLCPSEYSTGGRRRQGSINRHGNPRLRHALVEAVWRMLRFQPQWKRAVRLHERLAQGHSPARRKLIVALARELAIDLWRLNTGRATLEELGLQAAASPKAT